MEAEDSKTLKAKIEVVKEVIKQYPDFPKKGVNFVDYFSILRNPAESKILNETVIEKLETVFGDD